MFKNIEELNETKLVKGFIKEEIGNDIAENFFPEEQEEYDGDVVVDFKVYSFELVQELNEEDEVEDTITITNVEDIDPENFLKENNIEYNRSNQSKSFYIKLNNQEIRISDHKRPAQVDGFIAHEVEYENEYICENEQDIYDTIVRLVKNNK